MALYYVPRTGESNDARANVWDSFSPPWPKHGQYMQNYKHNEHSALLFQAIFTKCQDRQK
jgi:hypothetical protein